MQWNQKNLSSSHQTFFQVLCKLFLPGLKKKFSQKDHNQVYLSVNINRGFPKLTSWYWIASKFRKSRSTHLETRGCVIRTPMTPKQDSVPNSFSWYNLPLLLSDIFAQKHTLCLVIFISKSQKTRWHIFHCFLFSLMWYLW